MCVCVCVCSRVLSLRGEEVEETDLDGIASDQQTHFCANVVGNKILQVLYMYIYIYNVYTCMYMYMSPKYTKAYMYLSF